ncbi:MAG: nucleotidyltransferase domain-containing protein [Pseudomonadota bacterium]
MSIQTRCDNFKAMKIGGLSKEERSAVAQFTARLRDRFPREIEGIRLYGSKARGSSHKESDVDVLILVKKRTGAIDEAVIDIVCDILDESGVFIETVTMTSSDWGKAKEGQFPFALNVERDGIQL